MLALGIDIVHVPRFGPLLTAEFVRRAFTEAELSAREGPNQTTRLAGCFAAKEAVLKALGTGWSEGIAWTDIEVLHGSSGQPTISLSGRAQDVANGLGIGSWLLSLSHDGDYAVAAAVAIRNRAQAATEEGSGE